MVSEALATMTELQARRALLEVGSHVESQQRVVDDLRHRLWQAAQVFREYERHHAAKPDPEKAHRNAEMAELCEAGARV